MARSLNIETLVEDSIILALNSWLDGDVTITRWDDVKDKDLDPVVKVKATMSTDLPGTANYFIATTVMVDFGVFTSKRDDEDARVANGIRGDIRSMLNESDIVDTLNIIDGLTVYNNGVMPQSSSDIEDPRNWHKGLTILVVATTE